MSLLKTLHTLATVLATTLLLSAAPAWAATDVNRADRAQLESVKGLGPGLAGKILEARQSGPFKDWDDLVGRVAGIGPAKAGKLSEQGLTVGGSGYQAPAAPAKAAAKAEAPATPRPARAAKADAPK